MANKNPLAIILGVSAFFFVIFVIVAVGTVMSLTSGKPQKKLFGKSNNIGVIEIKGAIMDSKKWLDQIESFHEDSLIKGVIVRINSPGGSVAPSQEVYDAIKKLSAKKPVYASMGSVAASGGYYIACGAKKIFASPGTITGSIGVIMQFADLSKLYQWAKVNQYSIKTGKFKDIGSPSREMTTEERQLIQDMIDNVLGQFRRTVASARGLSMEKVIEASDGRIFSGEQAKSIKLVDELGGLEETVDALAKELGITGKPNLVYAGKKRHGLGRLLHELDDQDDDDYESSSNISNSNSRLKMMYDLAKLVMGDANETSASGNGRMTGPLFLLPGF
jgi:protease-4